MGAALGAEGEKAASGCVYPVFRAVRHFVRVGGIGAGSVMSRGERAFRRQELGFLRCKKFKTEIIEKGLDNLREVRYNNLRCGRLAQLVAHPLDVREVTSSSLVSSTKKK